MKAKIVIIVSACVLTLVFVILFTCSLNTSLVVIRNNEEGLSNNIMTCPKDVAIDLQKLTPFEWDEVYFFDPYVSKEQIFKTIGFRWEGVKQQYSEGMMQILFVHNGKVVCYCNGSGTDNGYFIDGDVIASSRTLKKSDNVIFTFDNELSKRLNYVYLKCSGTQGVTQGDGSIVLQLPPPTAARKPISTICWAICVTKPTATAP